MPLTTTTIGAFPKLDYVKLPDWFADMSAPNPTVGWAEALAKMGDEAQDIIKRGVDEAVCAQVAVGVDIPTDGEIARENYIHYHCRHLMGVDFQKRTEKKARHGNYCALLPTVRGAVSPRDLFLADDWRCAQQATDKPVKITMPGPLTLADTVVDEFYGDVESLGKAVAAALNTEVISLAKAGCKHIQIDEPLFARQPQNAVAFGVENLERAFHGCPSSVMRTVHVCCGYPDRLDAKDYPKAPLESYSQIADSLEDSTITAISLEDAHRHNDLTLLERYKTSTVILGVAAIAQSRVESVEEIRQRLKAALSHIDKERLFAAPDCGLGMLGRKLAEQKLKNLCEAAHSLP